MLKMMLMAAAASLLLASPVSAETAKDGFFACYTVEDFVGASKYADNENALVVYWAAKVLEGKCAMIEPGEEYTIEGDLSPIPLDIIKRKGDERKLYAAKGNAVGDAPDKTAASPYKQCLAKGDSADAQHIKDCVDQYGTKQEKEAFYRSLAEEWCTEITGDDRTRESEKQRCIRKYMKNPKKLCTGVPGDYLSIKCR